MNCNISTDEIVQQIEHLMYGHNYQVTFGLDILEHCQSIEEAKAQVQQKYPAANMENIQQIDEQDIWKNVEYAFSYRGDAGAGLELLPEEEKQIEILQKRYTAFLKQFLMKTTSLYWIVDACGIPGYPVFWEYRYLCVNNTGKSLFVYASASD